MIYELSFVVQTSLKVRYRKYVYKVIEDIVFFENFIVLGCFKSRVILKYELSFFVIDMNI